MTILSHGPLPLEHLDGNGCLLVLVGCEGLRLLGGDYRVAANELGHDTTHGFDTQSERGNV